MQYHAHSAFTFPSAFEGLWVGQPEFTPMGPWTNDNPYEFSISKVSNGDYLMEVNLDPNDILSGWQRFYIEGDSDSPGLLWYCGVLNNYVNASEDAGRDYFILQTQSDTSITWCLDTDSDSLLNEQSSPFPSACRLCDCANWTISLIQNDTVSGGYYLSSNLQMAGAENHTHSKHLSVDMTLIGPPPIIDETNWPEHGSNFSCDFNDRDNQPIDRSSPEQDINMKKKTGCVFMNQKKSNHENTKKTSEKTIDTKTDHNQGDDDDYTYCYTLNQYLDYKLSWTLRLDDNMIDIKVSSSTYDINSYIALGFRPLGRVGDYENELEPLSTGKRTNFGMAGADIVVGYGNGEVKNLYAQLYTGPPEDDDSLLLYNTSVEFKPWDESDPTGGGNTILKFTRPISGTGKLNTYDLPPGATSIISQGADLIWAIGDSTTSTNDDTTSCSYHDKTRGLAFMDWEHPTYLPEFWQC